jgi:hypothetical protein
VSTIEDLDELLALLDHRSFASVVRLVLTAHFRQLANVDAVLLFPQTGAQRPASDAMADFSIGEYSAMEHCANVAILARATVNIAIESIAEKRPGGHDA